MLEKIRLRRFQNHEDTTIEFDPFVTTIVGASDEGKSAIIRALSFVCLNKPSGIGFIKDDHKKASVTINCDGRKVNRSRGRSTNTYLLDGKHYRAFRSGVPDEIGNLLNISDVNFQRQLDLPYWFTESPGKVSKNLNSIINLQIIDQTIAKVAQELRSAKSRLEATRERLAEARKVKKELSFVPQLLKEYQELKALEVKYSQIAQNRANLGELCSQVQSHSLTRDRANLGLLEGKECVALGHKAQRYGNECRELSDLINQITKLKEAVNTPEPDLTKLLAFRKRGDELAESRRELEYLIKDITKEKENLCLIENQLRTTEKLLHKKSKGRCPVCGQLVSTTDR